MLSRHHGLRKSIEDAEREYQKKGRHPAGRGSEATQGAEAEALGRARLPVARAARGAGGGAAHEARQLPRVERGAQGLLVGDEVAVEQRLERALHGDHPARVARL